MAIGKRDITWLQVKKQGVVASVGTRSREGGVRGGNWQARGPGGGTGHLRSAGGWQTRGWQKGGCGSGYLCTADRLPPITQQGSSLSVAPPASSSLLFLMDVRPPLPHHPAFLYSTRYTLPLPLFPQCYRHSTCFLTLAALLYLLKVISETHLPVIHILIPILYSLILILIHIKVLKK